MIARIAPTQITSSRPPHVRVGQSLSHVKPCLKPQQQQQLRQQVEQQLHGAELQELQPCISLTNLPSVPLAADASPSCRVYMTVAATDVDGYGVVANTMYHEFMYKARVAAVASAGFPLEALLEQHGVMTATKSVTIHFKSPLQHGDRFFAESIPCEVKSATVRFRERVVRLSSSGEEEVAAEGEAHCVALLPACPPVKPVRIPAPLRRRC